MSVDYLFDRRQVIGGVLQGTTHGRQYVVMLVRGQTTATQELDRDAWLLIRTPTGQ